MLNATDIELTEQQKRVYEEMYQGLATKKPLTVSDLTKAEISKLASKVEKENKQIEKDELAAEALKAKQDAIKLKELQNQESVIDESDVDDYNKDQYIRIMDEHFSTWAYIATKNVFMNFNTNVTMNKEGFSDLLGHIEFPLKNEVVKGTVKLKKATLAADSFNKNQFKIYPKVHTTELDSKRPCGDVSIKEGVATLNTWSGLYALPVKHQNNAVSMYLDLVHKVIPEEDVKTFLQWNARLIQSPTDKILWSMLLIGTNGNGKTTLAMVGANIIGSKYTKVISKETLKDSFNGWINSKCLAVIEEIKIGGDFAIIDKLKQYVTNDTISVRSMKTDAMDVKNHCDLIICSNYIDAIKITDEERRWYPIMTNQRPGDSNAVNETFGPNRGAEYFKKFYEEVIHSKEALQSICDYFMEMDLTDFNVGSAPNSGHKEEFVRMSIGNNAMLIQDIIEDYSLDVKGVVLKRSIDDVAKTRGIRLPTAKAYKPAMEELGYVLLGRANIYGGTGSDKSQIYAKENIAKILNGPGAAWSHYKDYCSSKNTYVHDIQEKPYILSQS